MVKLFALVLFIWLATNSTEAGLAVNKKDCGADKLTPNDEFAAVKEVLEIVRKEKIGGMYSSSVAGDKVWAQAKCLAPGDCRPCVTQLIDEIWKICDNAKSANVETPDCSLRYEFNEF